MRRRNEQPMLFELPAGDEFEPPLRPALAPTLPSLTAKSDSTPGGLCRMGTADQRKCLCHSELRGVGRLL